MRLPNGFVTHGRERLARFVKRDGERLARFVKRDRERLARFVKRDRRSPTRSAKRDKGRLARTVTRGRERLARRVNRDQVRFARSVIVALALLLGGGTAAALALLPPGVVGSAAQRRGLAAEVAPSAIAEGDLGDSTTPHRAGADYYRTTASKHVAAVAETGFVPLYREAERVFGVSWRLLASIHRQETAFSTVASTYHGLNAFGCCAGPMQFNVSNGPPSTWARYHDSFRLGHRPRRYPHPTRHHPSIYDDFDAIMAAGALLRDAGAGPALDIGSWSAAYDYYGHDHFGTRYASQVLGRAAGWERYGFCLNCATDGTLVAEFDESYGEEARRQLRAAEKKHKKHKTKKHEDDQAKRKAKAPKAPRASATDEDTPAPPEPAVTTPSPDPSTTTTMPTTTETAPQPAAAAPAVKTCTKLERLLGCRD